MICLLKSYVRLTKLIKKGEETYYRVIQSRNVQDLERAIVGTESILELIGSDPALRRSHLDRLSMLLIRSFTITGNASHLNRARQNLISTLSVESDVDAQGYVAINYFYILRSNSLPRTSSKARIEVLCNLAQILRTRFLETSNETDLNDAITFASSAVAASSAAGPSQLHASAKHIFANALKSRYQLHSNLDDLDSAIANIEDAMQLCSKIPCSDSKHLAPSVNQFALMMRLRFQALGELLDLDTAIQKIQSVLEGKFLLIH